MGVEPEDKFDSEDELKALLERWTTPGPQHSFKSLACPVKPGLYGAYVRVHDGRDLVQTQLFILVQDQGFSLQVRQIEDRVSNLRSQLLIKQPSQRRMSRRNFRLVCHFFEPRLATRIPEMLQRQVSGDRKQIRSQRRTLGTIAFWPPNQA